MRPPPPQQRSTCASCPPAPDPSSRSFTATSLVSSSSRYNSAGLCHSCAGVPASVIMDSSLADLIEDWHDFDLLVGTAAATLVGLMFVAASIGASIYTEKNRPGMQAFISPTVVHFTSVLVLALLAL